MRGRRVILRYALVAAVLAAAATATPALVHGQAAVAVTVQDLLHGDHRLTVACSEMVVLPAFNKSAKLPEGETAPVEFLPAKTGEYEFACQMGMSAGG